jgi:hypothetical protein
MKTGEKRKGARKKFWIVIMARLAARRADTEELATLAGETFRG